MLLEGIVVDPLERRIVLADELFWRIILVRLLLLMPVLEEDELRLLLKLEFPAVVAEEEFRPERLLYTVRPLFELFPLNEVAEPLLLRAP